MKAEASRNITRDYVKPRNPETGEMCIYVHQGTREGQKGEVIQDLVTEANAEGVGMSVDPTATTVGREVDERTTTGAETAIIVGMMIANV